MRAGSTRPDASTIPNYLEGLFDGNVDAVFNVAHRVVWNRADAEDVVQKTFVKAVTRLDQVRELDKVRPWLLQVAYREAISLLRARRDVPTDPEQMPEAPSDCPGPADQAIAAEVARVLERALEGMDQRERMAVVLRDVEQLPMREVADVLEIGLSAAKMRVHRGRSSLRQILESQGAL